MTVPPYVRFWKVRSAKRLAVGAGKQDAAAGRFQTAVDDDGLQEFAAADLDAASSSTSASALPTVQAAVLSSGV